MVSQLDWRVRSALETLLSKKSTKPESDLADTKTEKVVTTSSKTVVLIGRDCQAAAENTVWLGSTYGAVTSWSDTQVIATVALGSQTGTKIFRSNALDFTETRTLHAADARGQPLHGLMWSSSDTTVGSLSNGATSDGCPYSDRQPS